MKMFLTIPGVTGDSVAAGHEGDFTLYSMSYGAISTATVSGGGAGAGKVTFSAITITLSDYNAPYFLSQLVTGKHVSSATIKIGAVGKEGSVPYETITLQNFFVTQVQVSAGGDTPTMAVDLLYSKIKVEQPNIGTFNYDVSANKGG